MMSLPRASYIAIIFVVAIAGWSARFRATDAGHMPILVNTCLITSDVKELVRFYEPILGRRARMSGDDYAEFYTGAGVLAIFSAAAQEKYIPGSAEAAKNKSAILEFKVADVDSEYARLRGLVKIWVKPPTTQPWGTRSVYFRDPDGNLVDFYTPPRVQ
jgi:catechol 2,3-dioxygenase-like lactoylglutathione lyase family enzyme